MDQSNLDYTEVAIIKGVNSKVSVLDGINKLGGISKYVKSGEQVFIKFNLRLPYGFPTNTNLDTLEAIIQSCNEAGAKKVIVGGFPFKGMPIKAISDSLRLKDYFKNIGAELAFLDNSNFFSQKGFDTHKLKLIKARSFSKVEINNKEFMIPKVIQESNKLISVNQVNVDPVFKFRLSLLNCFSLVPNSYQKIEKVLSKGKDYFLQDQYKQNLVSKIIDIFTIKKPNLIINDLFYILEGAGPYIYTDSNLKKTGVVVIGSDAVAVDRITSKIINLDVINNDLLLEARKRNLGISDLSKIKVIGEKLENFDINIEHCVYKLEDINLRNFSINLGQICSGCYEQAYHLLNLMKTNMVKDLKYISPDNSLLLGENPPEPENLDNNIILFGDCAINSTKRQDFRKKVNEHKKGTKIKYNKRILEIPGCPPDIFNSIDLLLKFYGKNNVPTLNLLDKTNRFYFHQKIREKLKLWEAL